MKTISKSKSSLLTILSVLVVVSILGFGIVKFEQNRKLANIAAAQSQAIASAKQAEVANAQKEQVVTLTNKLTLSETRKAAVCSYVASLSTAKPTRGLVTLPVLNCTPVN